MSQAPRYVEAFADVTLAGKPLKVRVWVDLWEIANQLAPKAKASQSGIASYWRGAVKVSVVKP
jgi:hypothetical protein